MVGAVCLHVGGIGNGPVGLLQQRGGRTPIPNFLGPVEISLIAGIASQTSGQLEETTVGDGVLDHVSALVGPNLPAQTTSAGGRIPSRNLSIKYTLGQRYPGGIAFALREVEFGGGDGGQAPKDLIIVSEVVALVVGEVIVVALLP